MSFIFLFDILPKVLCGLRLEVLIISKFFEGIERQTITEIAQFLVKFDKKCVLICVTCLKKREPELSFFLEGRGGGGACMDFIPPASPSILQILQFLPINITILACFAFPQLYHPGRLPSSP